MSYLIDTNVLLRFFDLKNTLNPTIVKAFDIFSTDQQAAYICPQVLIEYWVVATRHLVQTGWD